MSEPKTRSGYEVRPTLFVPADPNNHDEMVRAAKIVARALGDGVGAGRPHPERETAGPRDDHARAARLSPLGVEIEQAQKGLSLWRHHHGPRGDAMGDPRPQGRGVGDGWSQFPGIP